MDSIAKECQQLKQDYDACFNTWFCENFLRGKTDDAMCAPLYRAYQECVKKALIEKNIDIKDANKSSVASGSSNKLGHPWMFF